MAESNRRGVWLKPGALRRYRLRANLTIREAAKKASIGAGHWCDLEHGRYNPRAEVRDALCVALGVRRRDLTAPTPLEQTASA